MHRIRKVFQNQYPVRFPFVLTDETAVRRILQFFRNDKRRRWRVLIIREVCPHEPGAFLCFKMPEPQAWSQLRLSSLAGGDGGALSGRVITPAVIRAAQDIVHHSPDAELGATMEATIVMRVNLAVRIPPKHDVHAEPVEPNRFLLHTCGPADGIPQIAKPQLQFSLEFGLLLDSHGCKRG